MAGVLPTGFEPSNDEVVNPSWEVVKQLDGTMIAGQPVIARQLPCVFGETLSVPYVAMEDLQPRLVIAVGRAGGRVDISVEHVAINADDAHIPDNKGQQPVGTPIVDGGPTAWSSTLPIRAIVSALHDRGIPASVSRIAGTFVCNHVIYGLLHKLREQAGVRDGFVHIPWLPTQAVAHLGEPSMAAVTVRGALETAIAVTLRQSVDSKLGGGTTH